jgi:transcriptional regulator with XRE-family HTH domain
MEVDTIVTDEIAETFRENARQLRESLNLSESALADILGVEQPTVNATLKSGGGALSTRTMMRYSRALGVHWRDLLAENFVATA